MNPTGRATTPSVRSAASSAPTDVVIRLVLRPLEYRLGSSKVRFYPRVFLKIICSAHDSMGLRVNTEE